MSNNIKFIEITDSATDSLYIVNVNNIIMVTSLEQGCLITMVGYTINCTNSYSEIKQLIENA